MPGQTPQPLRDECYRKWSTLLQIVSTVKAIKFMWYVEQVINTYVRLFGLKQMGSMDINPQ